jgi:phosphoglycerol transferase MdoB-like AlkP superfamily enzyme
MKLRAQNFVLGIASAVCFVDAFLVPRGDDPGPVVTFVMGIVLVRRAVIVTPQPTIVIAAGCALTLLILVGNHHLANVNTALWIGLVIISAVCYALWEKIQKLWS